MFIINERTGKLTNFLAPSMIVAVGAILLSFIQNLIIAGLFIFNFTLGVDILIFSLLIIFLSQFSGILIVYFLVIPLVKIKDVKKEPFTSQNLIKPLLFLCSTFTVYIINNYIFIAVFNIFNLVPQSGYSGILLNSTHVRNPLNVIIYYLPLIIGAPVFEELLYRRILIPMLEKRGMAPFTAIVASSIVFAIVHLPNDLVNGNLYGGIIHCLGVFYISISLGIIYILTRNILFPIIIHSLVNFISFSGPLINTLENEILFLIYNIVVISIAIMGIGVIIYSVWRYFKRKSTDWVILLKKRSPHNLRPGLIVFLLIGIISAFIPIMIELISTKILIQSNKIFHYLTTLLSGYATVIILFLLLANRARFELNFLFLKKYPLSKKEERN